MAPKINVKLRRKVDKLINPTQNLHSGILTCDVHNEKYSIAYSQQEKKLYCLDCLNKKKKTPQALVEVNREIVRTTCN
jgi:hypothetical protein